MKHLIFTLFICLSHFSVSAAEPPQGKITGSTFSYEKLGWSFELPKGWKIRNTAEIARIRGLGQKAFKEMLNQDIPLTPTPVLYLSKGKRNRFTSDAVLYKEAADQYEKTLDDTNQQLQKLYNSKGIKTSFTKSKQYINSIPFLVYTTNILHPKNNNVLAKSVMLSALINKMDFTMSYICSDNNECINIKNSVHNSTFSK